MEITMSPMLAIIKPSGDPLFNFAGAYFPAWLACVVIALLITWLLGAVVLRGKLRPILEPPAIMVPAIFILTSCLTWLLFFSAK